MIILSHARLKDLVDEHKKQGQRIVFTNGVFDLLHPGHVGIIQYAAGMGDVLVVALNSDYSTWKNKGKQRPFYRLGFRLRMVAAIQGVNYVTSFNQETPAELIEKLIPDVLVKGSEYSVDSIAGAATVLRNGGVVERYGAERQYSTTSIAERLKRKLA